MSLLSALKFLQIVGFVLFVSLSVQAGANAQGQQCLDLHASIVDISTAYLTRGITVEDVDDITSRVEDIRHSVDEEAAQAIMNVYNDARWTLCDDGDFEITTYFEGEENSTYQGTVDDEGNFTAELHRSSLVSSSNTLLEGQIEVRRNQFIGATVALTSAGVTASVVNNTSFGSNYLQYGEFSVEFSEWEGPVQPDPETLTTREASEIFAEQHPDYRNVQALTPQPCETEDTWQVFMMYDYPDRFVGWMPWNGDYVFEDRGNGQWLITQGMCAG
jgi:hypothetical protein